MNLENKKTHILLLLIGTVVLVLSGLRWGVALLGWIAPVPFLIYLRCTSGWRSRLLFAGVLFVAWTLTAAKFLLPTWPIVMVPFFGFAFGIAYILGYLVWDWLRRGLPSQLSAIAFAAIFVALEWALYRFTPQSPICASVYTQLENLAYLQGASLFGITGLSLLIYWFAACIANSLVDRRVAWRETSMVVGLIVLIHIWGAFRIGSHTKRETVRVATVTTDSTFFIGPLPSSAERKRVDAALLENTKKAALAGAKMVVWNEAANFVDPEDEPGLIDRAGQLAAEHQIHLVMGYAVPREPPQPSENKYIWVGPRGEVIDTYHKHKPAPVEPVIAGDGMAKVVETGFGKATGAICYDMDFPQVGLDRASRGADIVFVPSADTPEIDPLHTQLAAVHAIAGGYSIIRSTKMGLSAGIDPYGRMRGWLSANETDERILLVTIPQRSIWTLYRVVGDVLAYLAVVFVFILFGWRLVKRRKESIVGEIKDTER